MRGVFLKMRARLARRVYAALLYLYPADFRRDYGHELALLFVDMSRAAAGGLLAQSPAPPGPGQVGRSAERPAHLSQLDRGRGPAFVDLDICRRADTGNHRLRHRRAELRLNAPRHSLQPRLIQRGSGQFVGGLHLVIG